MSDLASFGDSASAMPRGVGGTLGAYPWCAPPAFAEALWISHHLDRKWRLAPATKVVLLGDSRAQGWGDGEHQLRGWRARLFGWWRHQVFSRLFHLTWRFTSSLKLTSPIGHFLLARLAGTLDVPRPAFASALQSRLPAPAYLGIGGDRVEHVLWRIQHGELDRARALKAVVLLVGINNLMQKDDPMKAAALVLECARSLLSRYASTEVFIQREFPSHPQPDVRKTILTFNTTLRKLYDESSSKGNGSTLKRSRCKLLELDPFGVGLDRGGDVDESLMPDGVHFTERGYHVWGEALASSAELHRALQCA